MNNLQITNFTLLNFLEFLSMADIHCETSEERLDAIDKFLISDFYHPTKVKITLKDWFYKCGDGCCDNYGTTIIVNGEEIENQNQDTETILRKVLENLGLNVEIETEYDYE